MRTDELWRSIFKVALEETDLVMEVLDARNPIGTHNQAIEQFFARNRPGIQMVLILNKSDLVPKNVLAAWIQYYRNLKYIIYTVSARYNRGLFSVMDKIRALSNKTEINILIAGYPNTGKSTLIQALSKNKKQVGVSANAGFTRSIKKIRISNQVLLIDTPGVIPIDERDEKEMAIKACMVADKLEDPLAVVEAIYRLLPKEKFEEFYQISLDYNTDVNGNLDVDELIQKIGKKYGRLRSGGQVNEEEVQKIIIRDWQNNRLKFYILPPNWNENDYSSSNALSAEDFELLTQLGVETPSENSELFDSNKKDQKRKKKGH